MTILNKTWILFVVCALSSMLACTCPGYSVSKDHKGKNVIVGECTWSEWQTSAGWASYRAADYRPDAGKASQLGKIAAAQKVSFLLFAGSWCGDSVSEVPKIFQLFAAANIPDAQVWLYGLDRDKYEPSGAATRYKISRVPTLVVVHQERELGRIVEYPKTSWEQDLLEIVK